MGVSGGDFSLRTAINPYGAAGFVLAGVSAVTQEWSLPEFCWSIWLAGLVYTWVCIATASLQIIVSARSDKAAYDERLPLLRRFSPGVFLFGLAVISVSVGLLAFRLYSFLFAFYGLFLSVFAEMEPLDLFGRNGFINSDFFTPVMYLVDRSWPMAAGALLANWGDFFRKNPWRRVLLPLQKEIVRMHIMILALPFLSLIAWALFKEAYQSITIVILMGLFYLLPKKEQGNDVEITGKPWTSGDAVG
ncbi:MAG: hypothetical protein AMS18_05420 [Gemmatimonas sp. SG8_17]|nr:MAG: hypothetical protein AMS18_05420 [Gemmatimonas sp. SG8_17]